MYLRVFGKLISLGMKRESNHCSDGVEGRSDHIVPA